MVGTVALRGGVHIDRQDDRGQDTPKAGQRLRPGNRPGPLAGAGQVQTVQQQLTEQDRADAGHGVRHGEIPHRLLAVRSERLEQGGDLDLEQVGERTRSTLGHRGQLTVVVRGKRCRERRRGLGHTAVPAGQADQVRPELSRRPAHPGQRQVTRRAVRTADRSPSPWW